jgi:hypothetical protein
LLLYDVENFEAAGEKRFQRRRATIYYYLQLQIILSVIPTQQAMPIIILL